MKETASAVGRLASLRDPAAPALFPSETAVVFREVNEELPLREEATLESELSDLRLRESRLLPDMDRCGEPLL